MTVELAKTDKTEVGTPAAGLGRLHYNDTELVPAAPGWLGEDGAVLAMVSKYAEALATAETSIANATYTDIAGCSVALTQGTWLIIGTIVGRVVNALALMNCAITDNANAVVADGSQGIPASGSASVNDYGLVTLFAIVTITATTTYKLRGARGNTTITTAWTAVDGSGFGVANNASDNTDKGTGIRAIRLY